jgi:hypothetical protein
MNWEKLCDACVDESVWKAWDKIWEWFMGFDDMKMNPKSMWKHVHGK